MRPGQEWDPRSPMNRWHIFLPLWVQDNLLYILSLTSLGSTWPLSCHGPLKGGWGIGTAGMETVRKGRRKMCCLRVLSRLKKWYGEWRKQISSHCEIRLWILHSCRIGKPWRTPPASVQLPPSIALQDTVGLRTAEAWEGFYYFTLILVCF